MSEETSANNLAKLHSSVTAALHCFLLYSPTRGRLMLQCTETKLSVFPLSRELAKHLNLSVFS